MTSIFFSHQLFMNFQDMAPQHHDETSPAVENLLKAAEELQTKPLWVQMARLNPPLPNPKCKPHVWDYAKIRPKLLEAGNLVTEKQAERRVLMLINPARGMPSLEIHLYHSELTLMQMLRSPRIPFMAVFSWSCLMKQRQHIATLLLPVVSSLKGKADLLLCMESELRCNEVMLF